MDKSEENKLIDENPDHQTTADKITEAANDVSHKSEVVVKKSGAGFSLLVALIALLATAYLYYQNWYKSTAANPQNNPAVVIKTLQDTVQVLRTDLNKTAVDLTNATQQLSSL